jgi:hypothetical protein
MDRHRRIVTPAGNARRKHTDAIAARPMHVVPPIRRLHLWWHEARTDFTDFHAGLLTEAFIRSEARPAT